MKVVFLVLSFIALMILIRLFAIRFSECLTDKKNCNDNNKPKFDDIQSTLESVDIVNHKTKNSDSKLVLSGKLNSKQNLDSKYIGNVYRAKNGRFASKKELSNV